MKIKNIKVTTTSMALACFGFAAIVMTSCKSDPNSPGFEYMPDMYRSPSMETYVENKTGFGGKDSMTARMPVMGTIPRGFEMFPLDGSNEAYYIADSLKNPIAFSEEVMEYGKDRYTKMCSHCHGETGAGDGLVVTNGGHPPPPAFNGGNSSRGGKMNDLGAGKIVHTITYGLNMMGPHASQISLEDRWKIAHYIQELQGKDLEAMYGGEIKEEGVEDTKEVVDEESMAEVE